MEKTKTRMPRAYYYLWWVISTVYALWMCIGMKWDTYTVANTLLEKEMYSSRAVYLIWVAVSTLIYILYPFVMEWLLYAERQTKAQKIFCLVTLILGCGFITVYGFLKNPLEFTASMMGLYYPWLFKGWCVFAAISVFTNVLYMYRKHEYHSTVGVVCLSVGCAVLFITCNIPSAGEELVMTLQCLAHWSSALIFALLGAVAVVLFLIHQCRKGGRKYIILTAVFVALLALMLVLLVTVGKNGLIENLPMWGVYLVFALVNFTGILD